jgi:hypothetical protein
MGEVAGFDSRGVFTIVSATSPAIIATETKNPAMAAGFVWRFCYVLRRAEKCSKITVGKN